MNLGLKGKPVLVMASSRGIGFGVTLEFAREGARVMMFGRSEERLKKAAERIFNITGNRVLYTVGDITRDEDIKKVVKRTLDAYGSIYALFNNTGGPPAGKFENFKDEDWINAFKLTLLGYVRTIREVIPIMKKEQAG